MHPTHVWQRGTGGARFVLLHGLPVDGRIWAGVAAALVEAGNTVIVPDLPGYGQTPPLGSCTLDAHVAWLRGWLGDARGVHLVGADYGGLLAAQVADQAASLTLTSTLLGRAWAPIRATALPGLERYFYRRHGGRRWLALGVSPPRRPALRALYASALQDPALAAQMRATAQGIPLVGAPRLSVPVQCLWGREDRSIPAVLGWMTARQVGGRLVLVPGRHYTMWEHPEAYAQALQAWLPIAQREREK